VNINHIKYMMKRNNSGFTVLELLMVIAIISILAALLLSGVTAATKRGRINATKTLIETISIASRTYRNDFFLYPLDGNGDSGIPGISGESPAECLYYFLGAQFVAGVNSSSTNGPYFEFRNRNKKAVTSSTIDFNGDGTSNEPLLAVVDSWGNQLRYSNPGTHNTNSIDIYSLGPDGQDDSGNDDDITNWK
ncbi:type II secretion system protein GspG, partial [Chlamydiota bacterium]